MNFIKECLLIRENKKVIKKLDKKIYYGMIATFAIRRITDNLKWFNEPPSGVEDKK